SGDACSATDRVLDQLFTKMNGMCEKKTSLLEPPTDLSLTLHFYVDEESHHHIIKDAMRKPNVAKNVDLGLLPKVSTGCESEVKSSTSDSLKCKSWIDTACDGR
nr:cell division cycle protein 48 homolog [Tanacetum cinerariifolium]